MNKVKFNKNAKFDTKRFAKGDSLSVNKTDYEILLSAEVIGPLEDTEWSEQEDENIDLYALSKEELEKVNKPIIVKFLDKEGIEYHPKATKDELIELMFGE